MKTVKLFPFREGNTLQIGMTYKFDYELNEFVKQMENIGWSKSYRCYHLPLSNANKRKIYLQLRKKGYFVDYSCFLEQKSTVLKVATEKSVLDPTQVGILKEFKSYLQGKRLSTNTQKTYLNFIEQLLRYHSTKLENLSHRDIETFIEAKIAGKDYAVSTHRQCVSALKHFANLHRFPKIDPGAIISPRKDKMLPVVLSKEEVIQLLKNTRNLKHRAIFALLYSSGLRVGEVINLKQKDMDIDRRQVAVRAGKGRKDRMVIMAESFIPLLLNYLKKYEPKTYFVENPKGGTYSSSSIRLALSSACKRANIHKRVTPHTLRHSYATHMLENGVALRHIQSLLGHSRPETTMIYTHVTQKHLMQIKSPLDECLQTLSKSDKNEQNLRLSRNIFD